MKDQYWDIFLSYSSKDKAAVEKLAQDLKDAGAKVWFDSWEISIGDSITKSVATGLVNSKYLGIWITTNALNSGWVEKEWTSRLKDEIEKGHVIVLPLLAEKCELPFFLQDKLYADFTNDYDSAFTNLLSTIQLIPRSQGREILAFTKDILEDLSDEVIPLPLNGKIKILETLKRIPRSGKLVRLRTYEPKLKIRSLYDHILSMAYSADCLFPHINHGVEPHEKPELARCIAFHDLKEVILGDMPSYTNLSQSRMKSTELYAWNRLKYVPKEKRTRIACEFISMFLGERERKSYEKVNEYLSEENNPISQLVNVLDKIDPIINVWKYLHQFRGELDSGAHNFLMRMKDFFDYPEVKDIALNYRLDKKIYNLVVNLQDRDIARLYYKDRKRVSNSFGLYSIDRDIFHELIEGRSIVFTIDRGTGLKKPKKPKM
jgi:5'-deoxynucleotidase YfbR-like HD superfamily hydrolase